MWFKQKPITKSSIIFYIINYNFFKLLYLFLVLISSVVFSSRLMTAKAIQKAQTGNDATTIGYFCREEMAERKKYCLFLAIGHTLNT